MDHGGLRRTHSQCTQHECNIDAPATKKAALSQWRITKSEAEKNPKYDNGKAIYLFNINKKYDLDGDFKFNTARLINHSCDPNCEVFGSGLKIWVYAMKNIKKGEELSYDYGFSYDDDYKAYPCRCGAKSCAGYIVRQGSRWRIKKKRK